MRLNYFRKSIYLWGLTYDTLKLNLSLALFLFAFQMSIGSIYSQELVINEVQLFTGDESTLPWMELRNTGFTELNLADFRVSYDRSLLASTALANAVIGANQYAISSLPETPDPLAIRNIFLMDQQGTILDSIKLPSASKAGESFGRFPETTASYIFFPASTVSKGFKNPFPGPWVKLTNNTGFSPRDSAPNAIITHDNKFWIFEGWEYQGGNIYEARSNIWSSSDMVHWTLVNDDPPFNPYSGFISYKGKMWAFDGQCWSSEDGVTWTDEGDYFPGLSSRVTIFRDTLWCSKAKTVGYSVDGRDWVFPLLGTAPWELRDWPGFIEFKNKLWYFGGGSGYGTPYPLYYSDVWSSENGTDWRFVNYAPWTGRFWFTTAVMDNKLWVFGGYDYNKQMSDFGNQHDVWYTEDGVHWTEFRAESVWASRHAQLTVKTDSAIYVSCGFGGGGTPERLYNDVWKLSLKQPHYFQNDSLTLQYGDTLTLPSFYRVRTSNPSTLHVVEAHNVEGVESGAAMVRIVAEPNERYHRNDTLVYVTVKKRDLTVTTEPVLRPYGRQNPPFEIKYEGFAYDDDQSDLEVPPTATTTASMHSPAGAYTVTIAGGSDRNYDFIYEEGELHIHSMGEEPIMYPNPASNTVSIFTPDCSDQFSVELVDYMGRKIRHVHLQCNSNDTIAIDDLPKGVYVTKILIGNLVHVKRLVVN